MIKINNTKDTNNLRFKFAGWLSRGLFVRPFPFNEILLLTIGLCLLPGDVGAQVSDGSVLPFPPTPAMSVAEATLQKSTMRWRQETNHLAAGAPNILVILMDDVGFGLPDTYGGPIHTPTLTRLADAGISYNTFHTTSICSPTRASLLTGRNHHRVGSGTIAERASDWDGYTGMIPRTSATLPKVLGYYGYKTAAFGKWHNTPADETTPMGPFTHWPTGDGIGFDYFYGFLAGETSQYEPRLYENLNPVEPPKKEKYHLSEDLAQKGIDWIRRHRAFSPDKPFFMYWAPGAAHGPHQIFKEWADKYKGRFDAGWDALREEIFRRQKQLGWIPANAQLTPRAATMASWESIPASERAFQTRLMEVFAGYAEHADAQAGKLIDELDRLGIRDNTLVFYIWGDNGSSAEGLNGSISELLAQNGISSTIQQHINALNDIGGLDALGGPKVDNMYHAGWAWAGNTPFRYTKLVASHFGGTRNPLAISWPKSIHPDKTPRDQFHHVNDIEPTIFEVLGIQPPAVVDGFKQDPLDGVSMVYSFAAAGVPSRKHVQYFENNGSRAIYQDGWYACTFGPLTPWQVSNPAKLAAWDSGQDVWELYNLTNDYSQANDLASQETNRLEAMKTLFLDQAHANKVWPIGGGLWTRIHPSDGKLPPYKNWIFHSDINRVSEINAPGLGRQSNRVQIEADVPKNGAGVLYALGGAGGGLTLYMDHGKIFYEYNLMVIERYKIHTEQPVAPGHHVIEVATTIRQPRAPATVVISVDGIQVATTAVSRTNPGIFTASETFDVGLDLGSPVSLDYFERAPFPFNGVIQDIAVSY
jgi:arylsulfatase